MLAGLIPASVKGAMNEDLPLDSLVWVPVAQEEGTAACYQGNQHQRPSHRTRHDGHRETCVRDGGRASEMEWRLLCVSLPFHTSGLVTLPYYPTQRHTPSFNRSNKQRGT